MALATLFLFGALFCTVRCIPLGQTTVCETTPNHRQVLPNYGTSTVCETTPNLYPYGVQYPNLGGSTTVCETTPNVLGYPSFPKALQLAAPSTTVCETTPNVLNYPPVPGYGYLPGLGAYNPLGSTTVCENVPNVMYGINGVPLGVNGLGSTTVCESTPNVNPNVVGHPYYPLGAVPLGGYAGLNPKGTTTVCDTVPNRGVTVGRSFL